MSYYPIELDKTRNLKFGMRAINLVEKKFGKPIMSIEGMENGMLSMEQYATLLWAGLSHEDKELTPDKVMDLVDEYSTLSKASKMLWEALNEVFKDTDTEEKEKNE